MGKPISRSYEVCVVGGSPLAPSENRGSRATNSDELGASGRDTDAAILGLYGIDMEVSENQFNKRASITRSVSISLEEITSDN